MGNGSLVVLGITEKEVSKSSEFKRQLLKETR